MVCRPLKSEISNGLFLSNAPDKRNDKHKAHKQVERSGDEKKRGGHGGSGGESRPRASKASGERCSRPAGPPADPPASLHASKRKATRPMSREDSPDKEEAETDEVSTDDVDLDESNDEGSASDGEGGRSDVDSAFSAAMLGQASGRAEQVWGRVRNECMQRNCMQRTCMQRAERSTLGWHQSDHIRLRTGCADGFTLTADICAPAPECSLSVAAAIPFTPRSRRTAPRAAPCL